MPYYIDPQNNVVVVLAPGSHPQPNLVAIDTEIAVGLRLGHGQPLSDAQVASLLDGSATVGSETFATSAHPTWQPPRPATGATERKSGVVRRANTIAGAVEIISWVFLVLSVIAGLIIAVSSEIDPYTGEPTHPNVSFGLTVMFAGAFQALLVIMISTYIQARTQES